MTNHTAKRSQPGPFPSRDIQMPLFVPESFTGSEGYFHDCPSQWSKSEKEVAFLQELCSVGNQGALSKSLGFWQLWGTPFGLPVFPTGKTPTGVSSGHETGSSLQ